MDQVDAAEEALRRAEEDKLDRRDEVRFVQITTTDKGTLGLDMCGRVWELVMTSKHDRNPDKPVGWQLLPMTRLEDEGDHH